LSLSWIVKIIKSWCLYVCHRCSSKKFIRLNLFGCV